MESQFLQFGYFSWLHFNTNHTLPPTLRGEGNNMPSRSYYTDFKSKSS